MPRVNDALNEPDAEPEPPLGRRAMACRHDMTSATDTPLAPRSPSPSEDPVMCDPSEGRLPPVSEDPVMCFDDEGNLLGCFRPR
ncbi:unnamed protein product [Vitrella brassicaformis CCMP3155]|uniref:Uncharacterized protein n=1 Tax=Vitrella brassicaformis (strain CCMP3155) TaxID=1169540 RepID=A0A0G4FG40_VITBC|nr:unnamed protein product [Vitrella brassicaformis CCMP3155]|eukprot:CEM12232.1 unnamed protein product [Vitrella brassicaformis CCMP3155]